MSAPITDFTQFAELRWGAENNDSAALREVAGQFEALFLETMLKNMREASLGDPLFGDSDQHEMYQGMLDQQLSVEMSSGKGVGLAEMLVRQLGGDEPATPSLHRDFPISRVRRVSASASTSKPAVWKDAESFARDIWPHAKRVAEKLNVAPQAILAQAALETGWGKHVMSAHNGTASNNLFGIKAGQNWSGASVVRNTIEFDSGVAQQQSARFRSYSGVAESFDDYFALLAGNPRYAAVRDHGSDIGGFAKALQQGGYATDPAYAEKISRIADSDTMQRVMVSLKAAPGVSIKN